MNKKKVSESKVIYQYGVMAGDLNTGGTMYGPKIIDICDHSSGQCAIKHIRGPVATISVDSIQFVRPLYEGDFLLAESMVSGVGNTSIEIFTKIFVEKAMTGQKELAVMCFLTFKAKKAEPGSMPEIVAETEEEKIIIEGYSKRKEINKKRQSYNKELRELLEKSTDWCGLFNFYSLCHK